MAQKKRHIYNLDIFTEPRIPIKRATMSGVVSSTYPITNLYDGNYKTFAHTLGAAFDGFVITLELTSPALVTHVKVANRQDQCCQFRILGFDVYLKKTTGKEVVCGSITEERDVYEFQCSGVSAEVQIRTKNSLSSYVNLGEVEVFGQGNYLSNRFITMEIQLQT